MSSTAGFRLSTAEKDPAHSQAVGDKPPPGTPGHVSSIVVLGGGLAGMAAAWRLSRLGHDVTLVERRPYLGGRAFSFTDRESGVQVDNGQHVFLGLLHGVRPNSWMR